MIGRSRLAPLLAVGASNGASLGASLATLLLTVRILDQAEFAAYVVALAVQALCHAVPVATSPQCGRNLASAHPDPVSCERIRWRAGWAGGGLLLLAGAILQATSPGHLPWPVWILLAIQLPFAALEGHHLQDLQMSRRFGAHALAQPLSRVLRLAGTGAVFGFHLTGSVWIAGVQALAQAAAVGLLLRSAHRDPAPTSPTTFSWSDAGWNTLSGAVVWSATRANLLVSGTRLDATQTALYGLADTLASSLLVVLQSMMTLAQPRIYRWKGSDGPRALLRTALAVGLAGSLTCILAGAAAPFVLDAALDHKWNGTAAAFQILCLGGIFQSWAAVSGAILHRHQASRTILLLESLAGASMLAWTGLLPNGATATQAAAGWALGRAVWALGGSIAAWRRVGATLREAA